MTTSSDLSASAAAFAALTAIENGEWDRFLHRIHGAIHTRQQTDDYQSTLVAGGADPEGFPVTTDPTHRPREGTQ